MAPDVNLDDVPGTNGTDGAGTLLSSLKSKELLIPAVLSAFGAVAAAKGPDVVRRLASSTREKTEEEAERLGAKGAEAATNQVKEKISGGTGLGAAGKAVSKLFGGGGGGGGGKKTRRLPIQRWTDVAVPVERTYDLWTRFDEFPKFMHRVLSVQRKGDDKVQWREKIWFSTREWEARITDRRKNDRLAWKTTEGTQHHGVISFHRISDNLTRVMVTMEFEPTGLFEKMASGLRFAKRAVQADLARFKAYAEFEDAKGLEYDASRTGEDEKDEKKQKEQKEQKQGRASSSSRQRDDDGDNGDREDDREERARARQERRETTSTS